MIIERFLFALALLLFQHCAYTQSVAPAWADARFAPWVERFDTTHGLPSNRVSALVQDHQQYLWTGTARGLVRFDGKRWQTWSNHRILRQYATEALFVDSKNRLWVGLGDHGACVLGSNRADLTCFAKQAAFPHKLSGDTVFAFAETSAGIWLASFGEQLALVDSVSLAVKRQIALPAPDVIAMSSADDVLYALSYSRQLNVLRPNHQPELISLLPDGIALSLLAQNHRLWIGLGGAEGIASVALDQQGQPIKQSLQTLKTDAVRNVLNLTILDGQLVASTDAGLLLIERADNLNARSTLLRSTGGKIGSLPGGILTSALQDHQGGVWIASGNEGLGYWNAASRASAWLLAGKNALPASSVRDAQMDADGVLWTAMLRGGVSRIFPDGTSAALMFPASMQSTDGALSVSTLAVDGDTVWAGTQAGLVKFDRHHERVLSFVPETRLKLVDHVAPDMAGGVWAVLAKSELVHLDAELRIIKKFDAAALGGEIEQLGWIGDQLWIAGSMGLLRVSADGKLQSLRPGTQVYAIASCESQLPQNAKDKHQSGLQPSVWLAMPDQLQELSMPDLRPLRTVPRPSLNAEDIGGMACLPGQNLDAFDLWLAGAGGLWRLSTSALKAQWIDTGASYAELADRPFHVDAEHLYIGTQLGLLRVQHREPTPQAKPYPVWIEHCCDQPLNLAWNDAPVKLVAHTLDFMNRKNADLRFEITTLGGGTGIQSQSGDELRLAGLAPGSYQIQASAYGPSGMRMQSASLRVNVQAPPWRRWWALLLMAALPGILIYALSRFFANQRLRRSQLALETERAQIMAQLASARTESLSYIGHEMRNLLNGVSGSASLLMHVKTEAERSTLVQRIDASSRGLAALLDDTLDYSKLQADRFVLQQQSFDLTELLESCVQNHRQAAIDKGLTLQADIEIAHTWRLGDPLRVRQIVDNLLSNAIKFTASGGVTLRADGTEDFVALSVQDTGHTIKTEDSEKIFQPYVRLDTRTRGTGLGLAICRQLAIRMQGSLHWQPAQTAPGNVFVCAWPLPHAEGRAKEPRTAWLPKRILIVEDEPDNLTLLQQLLEADGHTVSAAADGLSALAQIQSATLDLALLDLDLPGLDGFEILGLLRAQGFTQPVFALSGRADAPTRERCLQVGMQGLIAKPYRMDLIREAIASIEASTRNGS